MTAHRGPGSRVSKRWLTNRLSRPHPSVTVLILERQRDGWHLIVERHENCKGADPHDDCIINQRFVGPVRASRAAAEADAASIEIETDRIKQ